MKTLYTLLLLILIGFGSFAQSQSKHVGDPYDYFVPMKDQEKDKNFVISLIPSAEFSVSYLGGNIGLSPEVQLFKRVAIAPTAQIDVIGRYYTYGFQGTFFLFSSRTAKLGLCYRGTELNFFDEESPYYDDNKMWLNLFAIDARGQINDKFDFRFLCGVGSANAVFGGGLVYRIYQERRQYVSEQL